MTYHLFFSFYCDVTSLNCPSNGQPLRQREEVSLLIEICVVLVMASFVSLEPDRDGGRHMSEIVALPSQLHPR